MQIANTPSLLSPFQCLSQPLRSFWRFGRASRRQKTPREAHETPTGTSLEQLDVLKCRRAARLKRHGPKHAQAQCLDKISGENGARKCSIHRQAHEIIRHEEKLRAPHVPKPRKARFFGCFELLAWEGLAFQEKNNAFRGFGIRGARNFSS